MQGPASEDGHAKVLHHEKVRVHVDAPVMKKKAIPWSHCSRGDARRVRQTLHRGELDGTIRVGMVPEQRSPNDTRPDTGHSQLAPDDV